MPDVPAATAGVTATIDRDSWAASFRVSRAWRSISDGQLWSVQGSQPTASASGSRAQWVEFDGPIALGATWLYRLGSALELRLDVENMLAAQSPTGGRYFFPGRTFAVGVNASF